MTNDPPKLPIVPRLWLDCVAALRFLFAADSRSDATPARTHRSVWPIVPIGLLIGLAWVGVFRVGWRTYGETSGLRLIPSLAVVMFEVVLTGRLMIVSFMRLFGDRAEPSPGARRGAVGEAAILAVIVVLLLHYVFILSLQMLPGWWPSPNDWRSWFNWMYPRPLYRPLLLAPMWGRWCMLVALCFGRAGDHADDLTRAYGRNLRPARLAAHSLLPLFLTSIYCSRGGNLFTGPMIVAVLLGVIVLFSTFIAHQRGGQTRTTILAAGLIGQLTFIVVYRAFWRLIER